jgi:hypothetical protein
MSEDIPLGVCPEHGHITGDDVEYNFPNPSKCEKCGEVLIKCTTATESQIEEATDD